MTKDMKNRGDAIFSAAMMAGLMFSAVPAVAQEFAPEQIELIVPYGAGGGSTIHGQLLAGPLSRELPGQPTILVQNIAGAGSVVGINEFQQSAEPDGLTVAALGTGTFFQYLLKNPAVRYDLPSFRPFLASPFGIVVYGRTDFGLTGNSVADVRYLMENTPVYGGDGATAADLPILVSLDLLGIDIQAVFGLSNADARGGYERGEFQLNFDNMASWSAGVEPMIEEGSTVALFTFGFEQNGEIVRDPMTPDIPTFLEVYEEIHGAPLDGIEYSVWKMLFDIRVMAAKMFVLPAGTPDEILQTYADAMTAALQSEEMQSPMAIDVLGPYPQVTGIEEAAAVLRGAADVSDEQREWLNTWLLETYDVQP
jgi:tripartite-type tricarboxylate transporter receptor subunit TctC